MSFADYQNQAELVLRVLPSVMKEDCFALKGGTAINLFVRDMPRLSVDIDLTYLPLEDREPSLKAIDAALGRIASDVQRLVPGTRVQGQKDSQHRRLKSLLVSRRDASIKIEPNLVIRGAVFSAEERRLVKSAEKLFGFSVSTRVLSIPDLYGGKICAALDRQHPRDLFDIKILLDTQGLTEPIRKSFVVYLASHDRPMHELLVPTLKDMRRVYETNFADMTCERVPYEELLKSREALIKAIHAGLTADERQFLVSLKSGEPEWGLLGVKGADRLPAIQWKLQNIRKMGKAKHDKDLSELKRRLGW